MAIIVGSLVLNVPVLAVVVLAVLFAVMAAAAGVARRFARPVPVPVSAPARAVVGHDTGAARARVAWAVGASSAAILRSVPSFEGPGVPMLLSGHHDPMREHRRRAGACVPRPRGADGRFRVTR